MSELVKYLRQQHATLQQTWVEHILESGFLATMTKREILHECAPIYDNYLDALETGSAQELETYARGLSARTVSRGIGTHEVIGIILLLRDVLARSLFSRYASNQQLMKHVLDMYEPATNRIATTMAADFVKEHSRIINQQRRSIRQLSTPVLAVRDRLLIVPIIGVLDTQRTRQMMEQLLQGIQIHRAKVAVMDMTGVPELDSVVANYLIQTILAARLVGADVIVTGLAPILAQTLVAIGVDLKQLNAFGDLQSGIEEAEKLLGYRVLPIRERRIRES